MKIWLWKNGDHYLAFDSEYPRLPNGDPAVLGEPAAWAVMERRASAPDVREAAERIAKGMRFMQGKRLPIQFPDDDIAMHFALVIENAGKVARHILNIKLPEANPETKREP